MAVVAQGGHLHFLSLLGGEELPEAARSRLTLPLLWLAAAEGRAGRHSPHPKGRLLYLPRHSAGISTLMAVPWTLRSPWQPKQRSPGGPGRGQVHQWKEKQQRHGRGAAQGLGQGSPSVFHTTSKWVHGDRRRQRLVQRTVVSQPLG